MRARAGDENGVGGLGRVSDPRATRTSYEGVALVFALADACGVLEVPD